MPYANLDDAAAAALLGLRDARRESIGALYAAGDAIERTKTVSTGKQTNTSGTLRVPPGSLRALFHNHPSLGSSDLERDRFSADDLKQARQLNVPSYISAGNRVMRFDPRTGKVEEVLAQFPIEEFLRFIAQKRSSGNPLAAAIIAEQNQKRTRAGSRR